MSGFSLVRGGPFYGVLRRVGVIRCNSGDVWRQAVFLAAIAWLPIPIFELVAGPIREHAIILDLVVHVRCLLAIPLFVAAEEVLHRTCGRAVEWIASGQFIAARDADPIPTILARAEKRRDSVWIELLLVVVALGGEVGIWLLTRRAGMLGTDLGGALRPASAWYAFVALPLFNFLLLRLLFRWLIWAALLWRYSRFDLRVVPSHPDLAGGLAQLAEPAQGFSVILLGANAVIAAAWYARIMGTGLKASAFAGEFALLVALAEVLALGPLVVFSKRLLSARLDGLYQYRKLALRYTRLFHRRWIEQDDESELLGTPDLQSLADLASSYDVVAKMRVVPFGPRDALIVFAAVAAPVLPLLLTEVPLPKLLGHIGRMMLGGLPP